MLRWMWVGPLVAASLAANAANDGPVELRTKALAAAASTSALASPVNGPSRPLEAPFLPASHDPLPVLLLEQAQAQQAIPSKCDSSANALCYDAADGRVVYRGARSYLPKVDGLTAESVSVRRNTLVVKYTFR